MSELRYADRVDEPLIVTLRTGEQLVADYIDGGGIYARPIDPLTGNEPMYEVHGAYLDGSSLSIPQDQIACVRVQATDEEVEFGNSYFPGHPRSGAGAA